MIPEGLLMQAAKPLIDTLINNVVKPKLDNFAETCRLKYDELLIPRGEHFEEYLYRTYKKYSIINTLVFKNEQRLLKDLYIPLTIVKEEHHTNTNTIIKIDKYPNEIINEHNRILVIDTAGMGKSTMTKYLYLNVIENGCGIPIYIEMRRLSKDRPILLDIQEQINSLSKNFDYTLLLRFIQTGGFVFFLDGYDEIALSERNFVTADIQNFISKANNNIFIMTSRPEQALASFGDFQMFSINSLTKKEAYELLRKYDKQGNTSKQLIDELKTGQYDMINEFLKNPLLVSLLFAAFDYKHTIPLKKHIFYRQVYDAYFDSHDLTKGDSFIHDKSSGLDIDDFERILRFVGFRCLKHQQIEFEKDVLLNIIGEAKEFCQDLAFNPSDFFTDIITAVPLFCKDGQYYKWVHKSLQEYFAAQFIYKDSKNEQDAILNALYESENVDKYINLLDLYYDIDNWGFKKNILLPLCEAYIEHYEENIFFSATLENKDIENRIGRLFLREVCMVRLETEDREKIFKEIEKHTEHVLIHKISNMTHFHYDNVCTSNYYNPKKKILPLLKKRLPQLFKQYESIESEIMIDIPKEEVIKIDIHTGEDCQDNYFYFNQRLKGNPNEYRYFFSYEACKIEKEKILKVAKKKEDASNLVAGL